MKLVEECRVDLCRLIPRVEAIVVGIIRNFVRVERRGWNFDRPTEAVVVITLVVCKQLNLTLGQVRRVHGHLIVDRESRGGRRVLVGDHVEVEGRFAVVLHNGLVDDRARTRVDY